jgi:hypothetical protein
MKWEQFGTMVHLTHCALFRGAASVGVLQIPAQIACSGIRLTTPRPEEHLPWTGLKNVFSLLRIAEFTSGSQKRKTSWPAKGISTISGDER